ncbi:MAG: AMP-binding protein, partial [Alphaproteobacteria bacterium]|nr:AMP-binding protein [Alphaproteobacteria bacterium]
MAHRIVSGERSLALEDFRRRVLKAAGGLAALGVGAGDAVAILLRNDFAFLEASLGAATLGAYAVP